MGLVDVTELLLDPDFTSPMQIIPRTATIGSNGEQTTTDGTAVDTIGSVQPISGRALMRLPDALRVANISSFWVKGVITATATSRYPDILTFGGRRYAVQTVLDWSNFGAGWCEGTCIVETPDGT